MPPGPPARYSSDGVVDAPSADHQHLVVAPDGHGGQLGDASRQWFAVGVEDGCSRGGTGYGGTDGDRHDGEEGGRNPRPGLKATRLGPVAIDPHAIERTSGHWDEHQDTMGNAPDDEGNDTERGIEMDGVDGRSAGPETDELEHNHVDGGRDEETPPVAHGETGS